MTFKFHTSKKTVLLLAILVGLGVFLRFNNFEKLITFYGDHSRDFLTTFKIIKFGEIVWHGPAASVTWNLLSPIYYYLMLPFYLVTNWHPLTQIYLTTILSLITVATIFYCVTDLWGRLAGIISAFIYAVSTLVIFENLVGLNPGLVPIGTILLLWSFLKVLNGHEKFIWLVAGSLAWILSFHASAFFIVPPLLIILIWQRPKISKKNWLFAGLIFFILAIIPYGIQEKKHGGYNFITVKNYFFDQRSAGTTPKPTVSYLTSLSNYIQIVYKTPADLLVPLPTPYNYLVVTLMWATACWWLFKNQRQLDHNLIYSLLLIGGYLLFFGIALKFKTADRPNWWFGNVVFPMIAIIAGGLIAKIKNRLLLTILLTTIFLTNFYSLYGYSQNQNFGHYAQETRIAKQVLTTSPGENFDLKYIYRGIDEDGAKGPFAYLFWYFDRPQFQDKYFRWLNWQKPPADFPLYLIFQETSPSGKETWLNKYNDRGQSLVEQTNFYEIYKVE